MGFAPLMPAEDVCVAIELLKSRARSLTDFATTFRAYFSDEYAIDAAAQVKFLSSDIPILLGELGQRYEAAEEFTEASSEAVLRALAEEKGIKAGVLINGARVAITGQGVSPSLFAVMVLLGKTRVVERLLRISSGLQSNLS